mgnify:CR=1 FL=1
MQLLRRPKVEAMTGLSRSTLYAMIARGDFPKPVRVGLRAVAWRDGDIHAWQADRPEPDPR